MKQKPPANCNNMKETLHLMRSPANADHLVKSIAELRTGKGKERALNIVPFRNAGQTTLFKMFFSPY